MTVRSAIALVLLAALAACAPAADPSPYPVDGTLALGPQQRRDFVDSFLQGRWCEARELYVEAVDKAVRRDDLCQAARTARLAARLKQYIGRTDEDARRAAEEYAAAAIGCPELQDIPERDRRYGARIEAGAFDALARDLELEPDALYASVYARKGARAALERGQKADALRLAEAARTVDAQQGWVTFLREDWLLRLELTDNQEHRQAIRERIAILERRIDPCP